MRKAWITLTIVSLFLTLSACDESVVEPELKTGENTVQTGDDEVMINDILYPDNEVVPVNIEIDVDDYNDLLENAMSEEYYYANITYNGYTIYNVGVRTKGNSTLKDVAEDGGDRFSYNIDLNLYEDQDLFGIDKIILNNLYQDPTMMAEFLTYEALDSMGIVTPRTTYVALSINGEYFGLYLSVEQIGNEFVEYYFGNDDGELYKPENGTGANLSYSGDTVNYSALIDKLDDESTDNTSIIAFMEALEKGENIEDFFDVDSYLKYLAVSTYTVNLDSYQGGIWHNYYLYNNEGIFEWIGWDYNMSFNGFPMVNISDANAIGYLIDEPTVGAVDGYPLIDAILSDEDNLALYHTYLQELIDGYFNDETFTTRVEEVKQLIDSYVQSDPSKFYTYIEFESSISTVSSTEYGLLQFVSERNTNIQDQLDGIIPSTNNGEGNAGGTIGGPPPGGRR